MVWSGIYARSKDTHLPSTTNKNRNHFGFHGLMVCLCVNSQTSVAFHILQPCVAFVVKWTHFQITHGLQRTTATVGLGDFLHLRSIPSAILCKSWKDMKRRFHLSTPLTSLTHDIPVGLLAPSENGESFRKLFRLLKTCHTHYLENIRQQLNIRTDETYRRFFFRLSGAFGMDVPKWRRDQILWGIHHRYQDDPILNAIVMDIYMNYNNLFAFTYRKNKCPNSTNLIECYNSHLQGRLKTVKGFQTFKSAQRFLNAWMIRRRTKPFTDCANPFKHLNGKTSLQMSMKKQAKWPSILGVQAPDMKR